MSGDLPNDFRSQQNWGLGQFYCYAALIHVAENEAWPVYESGSAGISAGGLGSNPSGAFRCGLGGMFLVWFWVFLGAGGCLGDSNVIELLY